MYHVWCHARKLAVCVQGPDDTFNTSTFIIGACADEGAWSPRLSARGRGPCIGCGKWTTLWGVLLTISGYRNFSLSVAPMSPEIRGQGVVTGRGCGKGGGREWETNCCMLVRESNHPHLSLYKPAPPVKWHQSTGSTCVITFYY